MIRFGDTFYFLAFLNPQDRAHSAAIRETGSTTKLVTSHWIVAELGDAMSTAKNRGAFVVLLDELMKNPAVQIISASDELFRQSTALFRQRMDKDWSFTDCTSFVLMQNMKIADALTGDHHFEQAGFTALLK